MTNNLKPILEKRPFKRLSLFSKKPITTPGTAIVYRGERDLYVVTTESNPLTRGELASNKFLEYYIVDIQDKILSINNEYPSSSIVDMFGVDLEAKIGISDPVAIIKNGIDDLGTLFQQVVHKRIRKIATQYSINEREIFREELNSPELYQEFSNQLQEYGVTLKYMDIDVQLSEEELERLRLEREAELLQLKNQIRLQTETSTIETDYELERIREEKEQDLKKLRDKEERQAMEEALAYWRNGDLNGMRLILLRHEGLLDRLNALIEQIMRENREKRAEMLEFMKTATEMNLVDRDEAFHSIINQFGSKKLGAEQLISGDSKPHQLPKVDLSMLDED
ncbi:MAG: hypothetical protein WBJ73_00060 [Caldicoprobacterales bacterium]